MVTPESSGGTGPERPGLSWGLIIGLCGFMLCQSCIAIGLIAAVVTSLERRYQLSSFASGSILATCKLRYIRACARPAPVTLTPRRCGT